MELKLHEQIAALRRVNGLTQEALAKKLGVTNQAVSKWEAGQCCPDLALLPEIASLFGVSMDALMGYIPPHSTDTLSELRKEIEDLPRGEDVRYTQKLTYALHAILLNKCMASANPGWNDDDAILHAGEAEWGYSCVSIPEITTVLRRGTVLFSDNRRFGLREPQIECITRILSVLGKWENLLCFSALYEQTVADEERYVSVSTAANAHGIPQDVAARCFAGDLAPFLSEKYEDGVCVYRIKGSAMHILPVLSLLSVG